MGFSIKKAFKSVGKVVEAATTKPIKATVNTVKEAAKGNVNKAIKEAKKANPINEQIHATTGASRDTILGLESAAALVAGLSGGAGSAATGAAAGGGGAAAAGAATGAATGAAGTAALTGSAAGLTSSLLSGNGLLGLLGAGASAATNYAGAKYAADKSAQSAEQINNKQIAWERERATNAHQWEVEDLKNAGLNPVLSAGGQGAATGGISAVMPDTSGYQAAGGALKGFFELMNSNRLANAQADNINAQTTEQILKNPYVSTREKYNLANTLATTKLNNANSAKALSDINFNAANAAKVLSEAQLNKGPIARKIQNEAWESLHRSQNYDSMRDYNKRRASGYNFNISPKGIGGSF